MADDLTIAFISTDEDWFSRWASFIRDHGPAQVTDVIAERRTVFDRPWRVLVASASSPLLDQALVHALHERGRAVLAVFDAEEPAAKQRALELGADDVIETTATTMELMAKAAAVAPAVRPEHQVRRKRPVTSTPLRRTGQLIAVGGPIGAQPEPVALGLGRVLGGQRREPTLVVDANEVCPSLAQLVGLNPVPNLASAVAAYRASTNMDDHLQEGDGYWLLAGLAEPSQWATVGARSVLSVVTSFAARFERTVAAVGPLAENLGAQSSRFATTRAILQEADTIVVVGDASPVGVARLASYVADVRLVASTTPLYLAAGGAPRDRFRQREVLAALGDLGNPEASFVIASDDDRLERAHWQGQSVRRGPLVRSVAHMASTVAPKKGRKR